MSPQQCPDCGRADGKHDEAAHLRQWARHGPAPRPRPIGRPRPTQPVNRQPIGPATVRAAYRAHRAASHGDVVSTTCATCRRYLRGIARAAARAEHLAARATPAGYITGPQGDVLAVTYLDGLKVTSQTLPTQPATPNPAADGPTP